MCSAAPLAAQTLTTWQYPVKVTASDGALTKSSGCDGCADSGAYSGTQLTGDGYSEFVAPALTRLYGGLGTDLTASTGSSTINYAFSLWPSGAFEIRELGVYRTEGTYAAGDRFRVAVENGAVVYRRNGTLVYTSKTLPAYPLVFDVSLYALGAQLTQASVAAAPATVTTPPPPPPPPPAPATGTPAAIAPYTAIVDRNVYTKPALPTLGAAGSTVVDPVFTTSIRRLTDNFTRPGALDRSYRTPSSPHQNAWSVNSSYFYVTGSGGVGPIPFAFDPATGTARRIQPTATGDGGLVLKFYIEPQFSYVNDSIIYGSYSGTGATLHTIDQYDFSTGAYTKLLDLDTIESGLSGTYIGGVASSAGPTEQIEAFFGGTSQDHHHYVVVFDRNNPQNRQIVDTLASTVNGQPAPITLNFSLHHVMIDRSGRYVMLYTTSADQGSPRYAAQEYLWDLQTGAMTELGTAAHPYGHDAFGYGVLVNQDCCTTTTYDAAQWQFRSLASPLATHDLIATVLSPKEVYLSDHTTWNSARPDNSMPVVSGLYRYGTNTVSWRPWDDEIVAIQTNAPAGTDPTVWRFAHHRTNVAYDGDATRTAFWYQPHPNVSQDGKWILFTSNWEKTLGTDPQGDAGTGARQDVFLLALKPATSPVAITTTSVPGGRVGVAYGATLTATGGSGAYAWTAIDALPAGLSLNSATGAIAGTPAASGTTSVRVTVADASNTASTATTTLSFSIAPSAVAITTATTPGGRVTQTYSAQLMAAGGSGTYAWSVASGALPTGVSLDPVTGALSGTLTAAGTFTFQVTAADTADATNRATATLSSQIGSAPISVTTSSLPGVRATLAYTATLQAAGGSGSVSWTIDSGSLPAGITIDVASGALSGNASSAGTASFVVRATDATDPSNSATAALSLAVTASPVQLTGVTLPPGRATVAYSASVHASGGSGAYTWSVSSGTLPAGVTLDPAAGTLNGTPSTPGTSTFVLHVTDGADPTNCADASFTFVIGASPVHVTSTTLAGVRATQPYATTLAATGGTGTYAWSIVGGALPAGIVLNGATGALSGTPTAAGTSTFTARVTDGGDATNTADASLTIVVAAAPVAVATTSVPSVRASQAYSAVLQATGGSGAYAWSLVSGSLPAGVTLNTATGVLGGTPASAGTSSFRVRATDTADPTNIAESPLSMVIGDAPLVVAASALPADRIGVPYSALLTASGGSGSVNWAIAGGALPPGVSLNATTGTLSGTPSAAGTYSFTAAGTDCADGSNRSSAAFTITIAAAPIAVTTTALPAGRERVTYASTVLQAAGGSGTFTWSATGLPGGLTLNTSTGAVTGTPTLAGVYAVTVRAADATDASNVATAVYTVSIAAGIKITSPRTLPDASLGVAYSYTVTYSNASGATKWNLQGGSLPPGLSLNSASGVVSGVPTAKGTYSFNARVKDSSTDDTLTLTVTVK